MILVDTSIWIDHFRSPDQRVILLFESRNLFIHPLIIGEISMGNLPRYETAIARLRQIPRVISAHDEDVLDFVYAHRLFGIGIGFVDAHLLVSATFSPGTQLWTRDKRLHKEATRLGLAASL